MSERERESVCVCVGGWVGGLVRARVCVRVCVSRTRVRVC